MQDGVVVIEYTASLRRHRKIHYIVTRGVVIVIVAYVAEVLKRAMMRMPQAEYVPYFVGKRRIPIG